jgi:hypothetical protein
MQCGLRGILFCTAALFAQAPVNQQPAPPAQAPAGLETSWDIAPVLLAVSAHSTRLLQALEKLDANAWVEKGASPTYADQLQSCKDQERAIADASKNIARNPEQLAASLELLIRMHGVDTMLASLNEVIRKYQNPASAQQLISLEAEGSSNRDRFQQYLISFAADREHALQVMDKEAQRCRALLSMPAPATPKSGKKK